MPQSYESLLRGGFVRRPVREDFEEYLSGDERFSCDADIGYTDGGAETGDPCGADDWYFAGAQCGCVLDVRTGEDAAHGSFALYVGVEFTLDENYCISALNIYAKRLRPDGGFARRSKPEKWWTAADYSAAVRFFRGIVQR